MEEPSLSATERLVWDAFPEGRTVDLAATQDRVVRAEVLRRLLLGGNPSDGGALPALRLVGARVTGTLELVYADVGALVSLTACRFEHRIDLYGSRLQGLRLRRCELPGVNVGNGEITGGMTLEDSVVTGRVDMVGTRLHGVLVLDGARLSGPSRTLDGSHLSAASSILARNGFVSDGPIWLGGATVAGSLRWSGATVRNPGGCAVDAPGIKVGGVVDLTGGFTAEGSIRMSNAEVGGLLSVQGAELTGDGDGCLDLRNLVANEVTLRPRTPFGGRIDLSYARIGLLRDDAGTWPAEIVLDGLVYQAIGGPAQAEERLRWLRRDPQGYRPQAYSQLAAMYQAAGRDDDARTVRYAAERHRHRNRMGRVWAALQDWTVGYGYKPVRAALWLVPLLVAGTVIFSWVPPRAAEAPKAPEFHASAYTADLLLPVVDLGQQSAYLARGWTAWVAYGLIAAGLLFVSTAAAAIARRLQRG
ncbi:oxidoreductase [Actinoplanes aureus]|uniref:Oxidoreductase n=1 Tax=Actinoplanes aureus TaxID=2792083 RepID=A0A931C3Y3_9ACTN|nr:oxidoreductase [Actinoplanes aureus]MBG0562944.1 oxidoreductase [Actinoplanes aureus]